MLIRELAHARAGDKGNIVTISLIAYREEDYAVLERHVTQELVGRHLAEFAGESVTRYTLARLAALNFVLRRPALQNVTRSLALDAHGKCLSSALLGIDIGQI
jgi:hypothetical protein